MKTFIHHHSFHCRVDTNFKKKKKIHNNTTTKMLLFLRMIYKSFYHQYFMFAAFFHNADIATTWMSVSMSMTYSYSAKIRRSNPRRWRVGD